MARIESNRDLLVWQKGMDLVEEAYRLSKFLPKSEDFRVTHQLLRAAGSIPANIAEGHGRVSRRDYARFISIARGSLAETETFLALAVRVKLLDAAEASRAFAMCQELNKMVTTLLIRLRGAPLSENPDDFPPDR